MKKAILLLAVIAISLSCNSSDSSSNTLLTVATVQNVVSSGTWKISYLDTLDGSIKTNNYLGFGFSFYTSNNLVSAINGNLSYNGSWNTNSNGNKVYFTINYLNPTNFQILNVVYEVISITNNKVVLKNSEASFYLNDPTYDPTLIADDLIFEKI